MSQPVAPLDRAHAGLTSGSLRFAFCNMRGLLVSHLFPLCPERPGESNVHCLSRRTSGEPSANYHFVRLTILFSALHVATGLRMQSKSPHRTLPLLQPQPHVFRSHASLLHVAHMAALSSAPQSSLHVLLECTSFHTRTHMRLKLAASLKSKLRPSG
jgi:hypothetical protein